MHTVHPCTPCKIPCNHASVHPCTHTRQSPRTWLHARMHPIHDNPHAPGSMHPCTPAIVPALVLHVNPVPACTWRWRQALPPCTPCTPGEFWRSGELAAMHPCTPLFIFSFLIRPWKKCGSMHTPYTFFFTPLCRACTSEYIREALNDRENNIFHQKSWLFYQSFVIHYQVN